MLTFNKKKLEAFQKLRLIARIGAQLVPTSLLTLSYFCLALAFKTKNRLQYVGSHAWTSLINESEQTIFETLLALTVSISLHVVQYKSLLDIDSLQSGRQ